jgi:hypothetical protein
VLDDFKESLPRRRTPVVRVGLVSREARVERNWSRDKASRLGEVVASVQHEREPRVRALCKSMECGQS